MIIIKDLKKKTFKTNVGKIRELHQKFFSNRKLSFLVFAAGCGDNKIELPRVFITFSHFSSSDSFIANCKKGFLIFTQQILTVEINRPKVQNFKHFFTDSDNQIAFGCILLASPQICSLIGFCCQLFSGSPHQSLEDLSRRRRRISESRKRGNLWPLKVRDDGDNKDNEVNRDNKDDNDNEDNKDDKDDKDNKEDEATDEEEQSVQRKRGNFLNCCCR